jgi:hypothetical protein
MRGSRRRGGQEIDAGVLREDFRLGARQLRRDSPQLIDQLLMKPIVEPRRNPLERIDDLLALGRR